MNGLSLRITGDVKKTFLNPNEKWISEIDCLINNLNLDADYYPWVSDFMDDAMILKDKIATLIKVLETELEKENNDSQLTYLKLFLEIYLTLSPGNPLKQSIVSTLSSYSQKGHLDYVVNALSNLLCSLFKKQYSIDNIEEIEFLISCVNSCFENNPFMLPSLVGCIPVIIEKVEALMKSCIDFQKSTEASHVAKEKLIASFHSLTRVFIVFLQKISLTGVPNSFLPSCISLIGDDDIPLNTKTNLAIIISLSNKAFQTRKWEEIIEIYSESSPLTAVSLCSGILGSGVLSLPEDVPSLEAMFHLMLRLQESNSSDCKMVLCVSRGINFYTKFLLQSSKTNISGDIVFPLLPYLWVHLEHYMDSVRHLTLDSLQNIIIMATKKEDDGVLEAIVKQVSEVPVYRKSRYTILSALVGYMSVEKILKTFDHLVDELFYSVKETKGAKHVVVALEKMINHHFKETEDKEAWLEVWLGPLMKAIDESLSNNILENILSQVVKLHPEVVNSILSLPNETYRNKIKIDLIVLKVAQKVGLLKGASEDKWRGMVSYEMLEEFLHVKEDDVRLILIALVIENNKSSTEFSMRELRFLKLVFKYNINIQSPSFRQNFISLVKKFFIRFSSSHEHLAKIIRRCTEIPAHAAPKSCMKERETVSWYNDFIDWVIEFCSLNLFAGASFGRRNTALSVLVLSKEFGFWDEAYFDYSIAYHLRAVVSADTYEENKKLAKKLLNGMSLAFHQLDFLKEIKVIQAFEDCLQFASSIRPPDCISAAYSMSSLLSFPSVKEIIYNYAAKEGYITSFPDVGQGYFACIILILKKLNTEIEVAKRSIGDAALEGPLYGLLFVLRHILQDINLRRVSQSISWCDLIKKIISLSIESSKVVACIVNNSSPEGHFPMDLTYDFSRLCLSFEPPQVSSQLLLLCSWRTVKEVSLLLGEIVENVNIQQENEYLISVKDVLVIGEYLTSLLSELKHRGAFEQAYVGFCKYTSTLWKYPNGYLHNLPSKWLDETLSEISSPQSNLCSTRRSAGIPYIIQALVCTEREILGGKHFHMTIKKLIEFVTDGSKYCVETRIHSMNILRALFRNSKLGELVSQYVADGFVVSFKGFSSSNWSERNSATLLFSALMTRVFGVARSRSSVLSWKNKMTSRIFFQRYPSLYAVILNALKETSDTDVQSVFPVLLLLSRLYPSSLEGTDSNLELKKFIPFVTKCAGSKVLKVRTLAASALVGLMTPTDFCEQVTSTLKDINANLDENHCHGSLLQILSLLKYGPELPEDCLNSVLLKIPVWFDAILNILNSSNRSLVSKSVCLNILITILTRFSSPVGKQCLVDLQCHIEKSLPLLDKNERDFKLLGLSDYLVSGVLLLLLVQFSINVSQSVDWLIKLLNFESYEILHVLMDVILAIADVNYEANSDEVGGVISSLSSDAKEEFLNAVRSSSELTTTIISKMQKQLHHEDLSFILLVSKELPDLANKIVELEGGIMPFIDKYYTERTSYLKAYCLEALNVYCIHSNQKLSSSEVEGICEVLKDSLKLEFDNRMSAAKFLSSSYKSMLEVAPPLSVVAIWTLILKLLCDDYSEIRDRMSVIIVPEVDPLLTLELFLNLFDESTSDKLLFAATLIYWSSSYFSSDDDVSNNEKQEEKAFDKGDMNSYCEDLNISLLVSEKLIKMTSVSPDVLSTPVPDELGDWLCDNIPVITDFSLITLKDYILAFYSQYEMELDRLKLKFVYFVDFCPSHKELAMKRRKWNHFEKVLDALESSQN